MYAQLALTSGPRDIADVVELVESSVEGTELFTLGQAQLPILDIQLI